MNTTWETVPFSNIYSIPSRNGLYKSKDFHGSGCKVVNMGELFGFDFISAQTMKRIELTDVEKEKYLITDGDLLFARRSVVEEGSGKCSLVVNPVEPTVFESSIIRVRLDQSKVLPRFYYYYFKSYQGRASVLSISTGINVKGIRGSELKELKVPLPSLTNQKIIGTILSNYDTLIENDTRRIQILEEMAQRIYKEWFVDFKYPGYENDQLVESELGMIPEGWEVKSYSDVAEFINGFAFGPNHWQDKGKPIIKINELKNGFTGTTSYYHGEDIAEKYHIENGDLLFSWSAHLDVYIWRSGEGLLNQHLFNVIPNKGFRKLFIFYALKYGIQEFRIRSQGTTMRHIKRSALNEVKLAIPTENQREYFSDIVSPISMQLQSLRSKNDNLRQTRDLLLPKLISGKIDVSDLDIDTSILYD